MIANTERTSDFLTPKLLFNPAQQIRKMTKHTEVIEIKGDFSIMVRKLTCPGLLSVRLGCFLIVNSIILPIAWSQSKPAYDLLPEKTQAVVWIRDTDELVGRWDRTQLSKLASDSAIRPFWDDQQQEIEKRFMQAGWRLNIGPDDLQELAAGQLAVAWIEKAGNKPFSMALIADVADNPEKLDGFFQRIEKNLVERGSQTSTLTHDGHKITKYSLKQAHELQIRETFYCVVNNQLLSTDDEALIKDLIAGVKGKPMTSKPLAAEAVFVESRKELAVSGKSQIEYFVRPLGFARVLRAIGGKRPNNGGTDILAVLKNQGFEAVQAISGEIELGTESYDIKHRGFTLANMPLPKSAAILDFPNKAPREIPNFVSANASALLATNWNSQEAFWKAQGIVDEMAGQAGVFDEVIRGIKTDPNGPKIDIQNEVLPYINNEIYSISDTVEPITTDSHRNLFALRIRQPQKLADVLRRAMKNEPDTDKEMVGDLEIWKKVASSDSAVDSIELDKDLGGLGDPGAAGGEADTPWLSRWAITVYDEYFLFASHVELIKETIAQAKAGGISPLLQQVDYQRMKKALATEFGEEPVSFWQVLRGDLSYKMQYELFRKGELDQSQSWLASLLDRLLQNRSEIRKEGESKVKGEKLPDYEKIAHYLKPSGLVVRTTPKGWSFGSLLLADQVAVGGKPATNDNTQTRVSNTESNNR
jgi:hypothetical protein